MIYLLSILFTYNLLADSCPLQTYVAPKEFVEPMADTVKDKKYTLPELPYSYSALKPYIDKKTMHYHHDRHHQKYVDNLNEAVKNYPELQGKPLDQLLSNLTLIPESIRQTIINNAGGHYNHSFYWRVMGPDSKVLSSGKLYDAIVKQFGSFDKFKEEFIGASKKVFGSGWTWLSVDSNKKLVISTSANQDNPLKDNLKPILCLDEWEHAYYLKYKNKRDKYIENWWKVVNWDYVSQLYDNITK